MLSKVFFFEKKAKNFCELVLTRFDDLALIDKSFCFFFQKEDFFLLERDRLRLHRCRCRDHALALGLIA